MTARAALQTNTLYCSFCGKRQAEVFFLVAGPTVFICDECIEICTAMIAIYRGSVDGDAEYASWSYA